MNRLIAAFRNSLRALTRGYREEPALRQEMLLLALGIPVAAVIAEDALRFAMLIAVLLLLITVELLNTAVERLCDRLHLERHGDIGYVKDLGSAAVLMMIVLACIVWLAALWRFLDRVL
jgi:diacylglycerol kinase (ATP)